MPLTAPPLPLSAKRSLSLPSTMLQMRTAPSAPPEAIVLSSVGCQVRQRTAPAWASSEDFSFI